MSENKLVGKLAHVMKQVQYIEKKGWNSFNKYKYATESDVQEKVREVLADQNVIMMPDVVEYSNREHQNRKGNIEYIATLKVNFTFYDGETGETISIHSVGEGQDAGDKAIYKAITGSQKYALMKAFMIPTGDDPENDSGVDERNGDEPQKASEKQLNFVNKLLKGKVSEKYNYDQLHQGIKNKLNTDVDIENWTGNQASQAIKILQGDK